MHPFCPPCGQTSPVKQLEQPHVWLITSGPAEGSIHSQMTELLWPPVSSYLIFWHILAYFGVSEAVFTHLLRPIHSLQDRLIFSAITRRQPSQSRHIVDTPVNWHFHFHSEIKTCSRKESMTRSFQTARGRIESVAKRTPWTFAVIWESASMCVCFYCFLK